MEMTMKKKFDAERKERKLLTANRTREVRYGYMDMTDYYHEVGEASGGNTIWPSPENLLEGSPCASQCGIARVKVMFDKEILEPNFLDENCISFDDIEKKSAKWFQSEMRSLKHMEERLVRLEKSVKFYKHLIEKKKTELAER